MKIVFVCVVAFVSLVAGAPTIINSIPDYINERQIDQFRDKRSKFGHGYFMPLGASSQISTSYIPNYQWNVRPYVNPYLYSNYGYQSSLNGCGHAGYLRSEDRDENREISDVDQEHSSAHRHTVDTASSTSNPQLSASSLASIGQLVPSVGGGPAAYGIFPNVPSGSCNVPLLFSCSPTIVPGRMRGPSQYGYGIPLGVNSFRDVEDVAHDLHSQHQAAHESVPSSDTAQVINHQ